MDVVTASQTTQRRGRNRWFLGLTVTFIVLAVSLAVVVIVLVVVYATPKTAGNASNVALLSATRLSAQGDPYSDLPVVSADNILTVDMVVVGAGVGGLFIAARLKQFFPNKTILVLEQGTRIGGRLESLPIPGSTKAAELGGMRYFPMVDPYTVEIVRDLQLPSLEVEYVAPENLVYFRGVKTRVETLPSVACNIYNLPKDEQGTTAQALVVQAVSRTLEQHGIPPDQVTYNPFLNSTTFWQILYDQLSNEAVNYYRDVNGYNFSIDDVSAAVGIDENLSIAPQQMSPQRFVEHGYQQIPLTLAERLGSLPGVQIRLQQQVVDFSYRFSSSLVAGAGSVQVLVQPVKPKDIQDPLVRQSDKAGPAYVVACNELVLAVPPQSLVAAKATQWPATVLDDLSHLIRWEGTKIFLWFETAWWRELGLSQGRSVTDLPSRQVWYWTNDPPILMIYDDNLDSVYWSSMLPPQVYPSWRDPQELPRLVREVKRQLTEMYSVPVERLRLLRVAYRFWPFGNYFWRPTLEKAAIQSRLQQPLGSNVPVYAAGDSFSNKQSWVDGCLQNCDKLMIDKWDLPSILQVPLSFIH